MEVNRKGETGSVPYRTGRFFNVDSNWYFTSRGGVDHGPYASKADAELALKGFLSAGGKFTTASTDSSSGQFNTTSSDDVYNIIERQMRPFR